MRLIGNVETKQQAERISAFLKTQEISTHCEIDGEVWEVWVRDEDQIEQAKVHLEQFRGDPDATEYRQAIDVAQKIARDQDKKNQEAKSNYVQMTRDRWSAPITKVAPFTVALIAISVVVFVFLTGMGKDPDGSAYRALAFASISKAEAVNIFEGAAEPTSASAETNSTTSDFPLNSVTFENRLRFASLANGEVWRAITPIFIHHGFVHLLFNMYMLFYFARQIEYRYSSLWSATVI